MLRVSSGDGTEATVDRATLTFTPANWNVPQTVTVTGVDDTLGDGEQTVAIGVAVAAAASDTAFAGLRERQVAVTVADNEVPGFTVTQSDGTTAVNESGQTDTVSIVLAVEPVSDVVVTLAVADPDQVSLSAARLVFTPANWNVPQAVTVSAVDNAWIDGAQAVAVTAAVSAGESAEAFAAVPAQTVSVSSLDDDVPGVLATPTDGNTTVTEAGPADTIRVTLLAQPRSDVVVTVANRNPSRLTATPAELRFTPFNWNQPQTVSVVAVDDFLSQVTQTVSVAFAVDVTQSDPAFAVATPPVDVTVLDNDIPGITIVPSSALATAAEGGAGGSFQVRLDVPPASNVVLRVTSADAGEVTAAPATLTFTPDNWNVLQTVTVAAVNDTAVDGLRTTAIAVAVDAAASDDAYDSVAARTVTVTSLDNDVPGFTVAESNDSTTVDEGGPADSFSVVLNARPTGNVVIDITGNDATEATLSATRLTFTPANWNVPQTVTVTGIDDLLVDGDQVFNLRVAVDPVAGDDAFDALAAKTVTTTVRNINFAGFRLTESGGGSLVTEAGATDTVTLVLTIPPMAGSVVIDVTSRDLTEVTAAPARLDVHRRQLERAADGDVDRRGRHDRRWLAQSNVSFDIAVAASDPLFALVTQQNIAVSTVDDDPLVALRRQDVAAKNRLIVVTNAVNPAGTMFGLHGLYEQQGLDLRDLTDAGDYYRVARGTPAAGTAIAGLVTAIAFGGTQDGVANEEVAYVRAAAASRCGPWRRACSRISVRPSRCRARCRSRTSRSIQMIGRLPTRWTAAPG